MSTGPAFTMWSTSWFRDQGISGDVTVRLAADGLEISGATSGFIRISTAQIARMVTGWRAIKNGPYFLTRVWLHGHDKPMLLEARGLSFENYAIVIRNLASQLARVDDVKRLWRGSSIAAAVELLVPMAALFLAALAISIFVLENEPWWGRPIPALVAFIFVVIGATVAFHRWPRPVRDADEFNRRVAPSLQRPQMWGRKQ